MIFSNSLYVKAKSEPVDELDRICKVMNQGYIQLKYVVTILVTRVSGTFVNCCMNAQALIQRVTVNLGTWR